MNFKEKCVGNCPNTCKAHMGEYKFCTNNGCICHKCHCGKDGHALNSVNCPIHAYVTVPSAPKEDWKEQERERFEIHARSQYRSIEILADSSRGQAEFLVAVKNLFQDFETYLIDRQSSLLSSYKQELEGKIDNILTIDVNPSNEDQRDWYRGLGREEAQREMREKVLALLRAPNNL